MLVFYRARGEDWDRFVGTLHGHFRELEGAGCVRVEAYRHRHRLPSAFVPETGSKGIVVNDGIPQGTERFRVPSGF